MNARPRAYPELSAPALLLGTLTGILLTASFVYIGLKLGFGLPGSSVAAILGFATLRGMLGRKSIIENNVNQTVASGINTASAGVTFTLPALFLLVADGIGAGIPSIPSLLFATVAGSVMGIVLIIPLRKQMVELERLRFPSGVAVATLLRAPGEGRVQGLLLGAGALVGVGLTLAVESAWLPVDLDLGAQVGLPVWVPVALYLSTANLGAGLLAGRGGLPFVAGGLLAWWVIAPLAVSQGWTPPPPPTLTGAAAEGFAMGELYGQMLRPLGIGLLIGGALAGVVAAAPAVRAALSSLAAAAALAGDDDGGADEVGLSFLGGAAALGFALLFVATWMASPELGLGRALLVALAGSAWMVLAGIIVAQATGHTDISPLSGLSLIAVTLLFLLTSGDVVASVLIGTAICVAINQCADMMSDLKTGHLVGSRPRAQQIAQLALSWVGPIVAVGVTLLLWELPGDGTPGFGAASTACVQELPGCLAAPQGEALAATVRALAGGDTAADKYVAGAVLGGALSLFPIGGMAVLVGLAMYLPFSITLAYGVGCGLTMLAERQAGKRFVGGRVVPMAAGLIVGEALTAIVLATSKILGGGA